MHTTNGSRPDTMKFGSSARVRASSADPGGCPHRIEIVEPRLRDAVVLALGADHAVLDVAAKPRHPRRDRAVVIAPVLLERVPFGAGKPVEEREHRHAVIGDLAVDDHDLVHFE